MSPQHTIREAIAAQNRYNAWEAEERQRTLPQLTQAESLQQYFDLQSLMLSLAPEAEVIFLEQNARHWANLRAKLIRVASYFRYAAATRSAEGD